ncbi:MAG: sigma-E processing peptidase SpoIIGA [Oscillospiraceae bacterium]|nr:sigma-E processing peptidase SpoIIGA [Oscillospiraceae bacterium]
MPKNIEYNSKGIKRRGIRIKRIAEQFNHNYSLFVIRYSLKMYFEDIFLINFALTLIILIICKKVLKTARKLRWLLVAATAGSLYAVAFYFLDIPYFSGKIIASLAIVLLAFGFGSPLAFLKKCLLFHIITYALGGAVYGIVGLLGISGAGFPIKTFVFAILFAFFTITMASRVMERHKMLAANIFELKIGEISIPCLLDTGNETDYIIAEIGVLRKILPPEFCLDFAQKDNIVDIFEKWHEKLNLKILPINSLTTATLLLAFTPAHIEGTNKKIVAIHKGKLTQTELYRAIA